MPVVGYTSIGKVIKFLAGDIIWGNWSLAVRVAIPFSSLMDIYPIGLICRNILA